MSHASLVAHETTYPDLPTVDQSYSSSAANTARLLFTASPGLAKHFALSMHERAAWTLDTTSIEHWAEVVMELSRLGRTPRFVD